jgi:RNA polymerase sigma-70 factor (ECF subfamily)
MVRNRNRPNGYGPRSAAPFETAPRLAVTVPGTTTDLLAQEWTFLFRHASRRLPLDQAGDLVQDTMVRALHSWERLRPGSHLRAWLLAIMRNLFFDGFRRRKHEAAMIAAIEAIDAETTSFNAPAVPAPRELDPGEVDRAIQRLDPASREVLHLMSVQKLSYKAAAVHLCIRPATVGTRLFRAKRKLRAALSKIASAPTRAPRRKPPLAIRRQRER